MAVCVFAAVFRSQCAFRDKSNLRLPRVAHRKGHDTIGIYSVLAGLYIFFAGSCARE
jgi:hypothetical protein